MHHSPTLHDSRGHDSPQHDCARPDSEHDDSRQAAPRHLPPRLDTRRWPRALVRDGCLALWLVTSAATLSAQTPPLRDAGVEGHHHLAAIYDEATARELGRVFEHDLAKAELVKVRELRDKGFVERLGESAARLFSPLL